VAAEYRPPVELTYDDTTHLVLAGFSAWSDAPTYTDVLLRAFHVDAELVLSGGVFVAI
jgi:hypothetical protein